MSAAGEAAATAALSEAEKAFWAAAGLAPGDMTDDSAGEAEWTGAGMQKSKAYLSPAHQQSLWADATAADEELLFPDAGEPTPPPPFCGSSLSDFPNDPISQPTSCMDV